MTASNLIYGIHAVEALLQHSSERIARLSISQSRHDTKIESLIQMAKKKSIPVQLMSRQQLDAITDESHQGVIAFCKNEKKYDEEDLEKIIDALSVPAFFLVLDGVQDPHNLGACLRSACAAGVHCVIAPKDKSVGLTPAVRKVASGAAEIVPFIQVTNLARTLRFLKEKLIWIVGTDDEADQLIYKVDLRQPIALVMGAEENGMRRLTREHCDYLVKLPMAQDAVSSLNVSVAAGIALFETVRQRITK